MNLFTFLAALVLLVICQTSSHALEPILTSSQSDAELKRPAEDRDWQVGDVAVTATLHAEKGWTYFYKKKDVKSALMHFETAVKLWPETALAILGKAYCLDAVGKKEDALRVLSECKCRNQISPDMISLAEIELLTELKRYPQALQVCDGSTTNGGAIGHWVPTGADLIPRSKVLLAMGDKDGAIRVANKLYLFGSCNPYAKKKAIELFESCNVAPPSKLPDTSTAKAQVHRIIETLISDSRWTDQSLLEKILEHKLTFVNQNKNDYYSFDDRSDSLIASASLHKKSSNDSDNAPSLTVALNYPLSLITFDDLKQWFPKLQSHAATQSGCILTSAYSDFSETGNHITFDGGKDPSEIVIRFTIFRDGLTR